MNEDNHNSKCNCFACKARKYRKRRQKVLQAARFDKTFYTKDRFKRINLCYEIFRNLSRDQDVEIKSYHQRNQELMSTINSWREVNQGLTEQLQFYISKDMDKNSQLEPPSRDLKDKESDNQEE